VGRGAHALLVCFCFVSSFDFDFVRSVSFVSSFYFVRFVFIYSVLFVSLFHSLHCLLCTDCPSHSPIFDIQSQLRAGYTQGLSRPNPLCPVMDRSPTLVPNARQQQTFAKWNSIRTPFTQVPSWKTGAFYAFRNSFRTRRRIVDSFRCRYQVA
jgi:hypothetical protein